MTVLIESSVAVVFPGQGSQAVGMMADFSDSEVVQATFRTASDAIDIDLWRLALAGPEEKLNQTLYTQPVILTASISLWRLWLERFGSSANAGMAGHSLGEYSALVAAGALDLTDAVRLVHRRGKLMQESVPAGEGAMAAVLGLDDEQVESCCAEASSQSDAIVSCANFNAPGQVVIAGHLSAVDEARALCQAAGAKKIISLPVSVPSHCALMQSAADCFADDLARTRFRLPNVPVIHNVDAEMSTSVEQISERLLSQLVSPVRWTQSVLKLQQQGASILLECGPGRVLTALGKRIDKSLTRLSLEKESSFQSALRQGTAA